MSFWNKNKLPAEFRDMTEDQISALLANGKSAQSLVDTEKAAREAAEKKATELQTTVEAGKSALGLLKKLRESGVVDDNGEPVAAPGGGNGGGRQTETPAGPPSEADWLSDPNGAFDRKSAGLAAIALHGAISSARLLADSFIRGQGPLEGRLWNKYCNEVYARVDKMDPAARAIAQTYVDQFIYVKGIHLNDITKDAQKAGDQFFSESGGSTGHGLPEPEVKDDTLTPAELAQAKKYGVTPERWLERKKTLKFSVA